MTLRSVSLVLVLSLAASLILSSSSSRASARNSLEETERLYADLMDASSILATIDSGLFITYKGKHRAAWKRVRDEKYKEITALLERTSAKDFSAADARALKLMRKTVQSMATDQTSPEHKFHCKDAQNRDLKNADLRSALYSCFDELGNNLEFEGNQLNRVSALDLLTEIVEPERRKSLFMAFVPLWKVIQSGLAWLCFLFPLIEPDRRSYRIRLSEKTHGVRCDAVCNF